MSQVIIRIDSKSDDAEILYSDVKKELFKSISVKELSKIFKSFITSSTIKFEKPVAMNKNIIACSEDCVVVKQEEHERIVLYDKKAYKIKFPNSIYFVYFLEDKIKVIKAYSYKKFDEAETSLYKYPFPNMLSENRICIGSADTKIKNKNYIKALENVIYAAYTHDHMQNGISGFTSTKIYFDYLEKNEFPYEKLISLKLKLKDLVLFNG